MTCLPHSMRKRAGRILSLDRPSPGFRERRSQPASSISRYRFALRLAPLKERVPADFQQVSLREPREAISGHSLVPRLWNPKSFPYAGKHRPSGRTAGISQVNCRSKGIEFGPLFFFFLLQSPKRSPYNLARILVAPTLHLLDHKPVKFFGQIHIASRHFPWGHLTSG